MHKILTFILCLIVSLFFSAQSFWDDEICGSQEEYALYECRVTNICDSYKSEKPVYSSEDYGKAEDATPEFQNQQAKTPALDNVKKIYRENMGNIYKCWMIQSQRNSLTKLWEFIKKESSGQLSDAVWGQIEQRIRRLELSSNTIWCALTDTDSIQNKLNILSETTHEMCKYTSYLEYIKSYYEKTNSTYDKTNPTDSQFLEDFYDNNALANLTKATPQEISNEINQTKNAIANEISHTYKVFPIAFHAYSEYENNFPIHFLLEVVRWDFLILRKLMYQNLMPIAQLGLKVINAMSH